MVKPVWVTDAGNLGTIEEEVYYRLSLEATTPDGGALTYQVISGYMPPGIILNESSGEVAGRPAKDYNIGGTPYQVSQDTTSTFCIRITNAQGKIADRTFSLTVTGQDSPELTTTAHELARVFDGTFVNVQLGYKDDDDDDLTWSIINGELPPGLTLSQTGLINGYVETAVNDANAATVGWSPDGAGWSEEPWSHSETWLNQNYEFTVQLFDGKEYAQQKYNIFVLAKSNLGADINDITVDDNTLVTADMDDKHNPILLTQATDFGFYEHDNYFAFEFTGKDFDGDDVYFGLTSADDFGFDAAAGGGFDAEAFDQSDLSTPPGLTLNAETGWLYGSIATQVAAQKEYTFGIYAYKKDNEEAVSDTIFFTLTIVSNLANAIVWKTASDMGELKAGSISSLAVETSNPEGTTVYYYLESGGLPQGVKLLDNGLLVGRASFETTSFDNGDTTFDFDVRKAGVSIDETTLDREFTFKVRVTSEVKQADGQHSDDAVLLAFRTFTVEIKATDYRPYDTLYLRATPGLPDKKLFTDLVNDTDVFPNDIVYRASDPNFGRAQDTRLLVIGGLLSSELETYATAMLKNHHRKQLCLGEPKLSKAYDENRKVQYEVIYYETIDKGETSKGSVSRSIDLTGKTVDGGIVYPNSLTNMRNQLIQEIEYRQREELPLWMSSRQADGNIIGWKPVVILSYLKPGEGAKALFNLKRHTGTDLKLVDLEFDRYILDNNMSKNYNATTGEWDVSNETTFDIDADNISVPVATVDAALSKPFSAFNGRTDAEINALGGLDGLKAVYEGKTVIFAEQEQYTGYVEPYDGWYTTGSYWDDAAGWDDEWDGYEVINGYTEKQEDSTVVNKRASVWKFVRDTDNDILVLEFQQEIQQGETVSVRNGFKYGGHILEYDQNVQGSQGKTVPYYQFAEALVLASPTTFNINGETRFVSSITTYEDPDESDKYLVFPKETIWD